MANVSTRRDLHQDIRTAAKTRRTGASEGSCFPWILNRARTIKHVDELRHFAFERVCNPNKRRNRRHLRAAFDVTDRGNARSAKFCEIALRQTSRESDLTDPFANKLSFIAAMRAHLGSRQP